MSSISLTPTQRAILAHALDHAEGRVEWFPAHVNGGARRKVLDGLLKRMLIAPKGTGWVVAAAGCDALGVPRPAANKKRVGGFEAKLDRIIANAEGTPSARHDAELDAAVAAVETTWIKPRTRGTSKQAEVIRMLQRAEGATIAQIMQATGWQAHTVRGTFAGAFKKKLGLTLLSDKEKGGDRVYRIA